MEAVWQRREGKDDERTVNFSKSAAVTEFIVEIEPFSRDHAKKLDKFEMLLLTVVENIASRLGEFSTV